jgi:hypothetical protein
MRRIGARSLGLLSLSALTLAHCGGDDGPKGSVTDYVCDVPMTETVSNDTETKTAFTISDAAWDETAVRQVLHVFAFGGFASDAQIRAWADMPPTDAIKEMLTLDPVNEKLSPRDPSFVVPLERKNGTLRCLSGLFTRNNVDNPIRADDRANYQLDAWSAPSRVWWMAAHLRGLNPVRQRVGLFETNYHMSVSQNAGVTNQQLLTYYDGIMNALARGDAYQDVLEWSALTAAVAQQYHHKGNAYVDGKFVGNEDFGREYHQLFFGIVGKYDDAYTGDKAGYHELVTIPNTAKALTGMIVGAASTDSDQISYGDHDHWQGTLDILEHPIDGDDAKQRFDKLSPIAIATQESLDALPVIIVRVLADDLLDPASADPNVQARVDQVRQIWAGMPKKNLLEFLRKYAISTAFHDAHRVKFWTSVERNLLLVNLINTGNAESFLDEYDAEYFTSMEDVTVFRPAHDVFGGQTGQEAAKTADVFRNAYNRSVDSSWSLTRTDETSGSTTTWKKDWAPYVPKDDGGKVRVKATAEWLWQHMFADGLANLGTLERAHLYAILASGHDLAYWIDEADPTHVYSKADLETSNTLKTQVAGAEQALIRLDDPDPDVAKQASYRISLAVNFLSSLPYMFAQQGVSK